MIDKIIIQDSSEVQSVWIPERRSLASFAIWKAFGLGSLSRWQEGQIVAGAALASDHPFYPELPHYRDFQSLPEGFEQLVQRMDMLLPDAEVLFSALDPDSATVAVPAPAFLMPEVPEPNDAATVAVAARVLHRLGMSVIAPTGMEPSDMSSALDFVSRAALFLGGPAAVESTLATLSSAELWVVTPAAPDEPILFGEVKDAD